MKIQHGIHKYARGLLMQLLLLTVIFSTFALPLRADGPVPPPLLEFASGLPGEQVRLTWLAEDGVKYRIEKSTNLETGGPDGWHQVALVEATSAVGEWRDPEPTTTKAFYRVAQTVAEVSSISPPLLSTGGGVLHVLGQAIPAGSSLVLNVDGSLISVPLALVAGEWQATVSGPLLEGASVIAIDIIDSFGTPIHSLNAPITVTATGRALDAPPTLPPGAPVPQMASNPIPGIGIVVKRNPGSSSARMTGSLGSVPSMMIHSDKFKPQGVDSASPLIAVWASKRGYDYYKAQSEGTAAGYFNPLYNENRVIFPGAEPNVYGSGSSLLVAWASKKGYDYYMAKSGMNSTGMHSNPYFISNGNVGEMPANSTGKPKVHEYVRSKVVELLGRAMRPGEISPATSGLPGEVHIPVSALFLACPAGPNIDWVCTYRSMVPVSSGHGPGWDFSYNIFIEQLSADRVAVNDGQGRRDIFHRQADDSFRCDGMFREGRFDGNTFTLTFADTGKWVFRPMDSTTAPGKILYITDRNGVSLTCNYDAGTGKLSSVSSQFGQSISISYTGDRISGLIDHTGRAMSFSYGSSGDLLSISSPPESGPPPVPGPSVTFTYSTGSTDPRLNGNLLSATDGADRTLGAFTYSAETNPLHIDYDTCATAERYKTGHVTLNRREMRSDGGYTIYEIDEVGRVTETDVDRLHRHIACRQYTGFSTPNEEVTSTLNRPTGQLRPLTDPEFFETKFSYNADSLCTRLTHPDGSQEITIYDRDFRRNCPPRENGNPRAMTLRTAGGEERTVTCDHQPGFGTQEVSPRNSGNFYGKCTYTYISNNLVAGGGSSPVDDWGSPVVRMVSAHGQVTTCSYDSKGNLTSVTSPIPGRGSLYQYNTLGQLISSTVLNGPGSSFHDTYAYTSGPGFLSSVVCDSGGSSSLNLTTTFERDDLGRITRVIDRRGNDEFIAYNALDQIVEILSSPVPQRVATTFHYDAAGSLARCDVEHRGADGFLVSANPAYSSFFVYDDHGLLIRIAEEERPVDDEGLLVPDLLGIENFAVCDITLNDAGECVRLSTPAACRAQTDDLVCDFTYDERRFLHRTYDGGTGNPGGIVSECDYDLYGNRSRHAVSGQGVVSESLASFDGFQRLSSETDPMGNVCIYEYSNNGYVTCSVFGEVNDGLWSANNVLLSRTTSKSGYSSRRRVELLKSNRMQNPEGAGAADQQDGAQLLLMPALMKAKEKANRTKCVNNIRMVSSGVPFGGGDVPLELARWPRVKNTSPLALRVAFFGVETEDETITCDRFTHGGAITPEVTTIDRSPAGLVQQISRNGDLLETHTYDSAGRLTGVVCGDTSHFFTLNPNGDVVSCARTDTCPSDAAQTKTFTVSHVFDAAGRITQITDGTGNVSYCAYDSRHRPVSFTEPGGLVTKCAYDGSSSSGVPFSQEISADALTPGDFVVLSSCLVRSGELRSSTDSYGHTTICSNDALGRPERTDFPDGTFETTEYDSLGFTVRGTFSDMSTQDVARDLNGRIVSSQNSSDPLIAPVSSTPLKTFTHDGLGRLTSASQGGHVVACTYDSLGNLISETQHSDLAPPRVVNSTYNHRGRTGITYPDGRSFVEQRDGLGRLVSISALNAGVPVVPPVVENEYAGHRVISSTQGNGIVTSYEYRGDGEASLPDSTDYTFDDCVRTSVSNLSITTVHRDQNQRIIRDATAFSTAAVPPIRIKAIERNRIGDLILCTTIRRSAEGTPLVPESEVSYTRDLEGRRLSATGGANPGPYTQTLPPGDEQMGQYTTWPRGPLEWDDNGNLISMPTATGALSLVHDVEGRLTSVGRDGVAVISYDYDPLGRCISRDPEVGDATTFVYDGDACIQELGEDGLADLSLVISGGIKQCISTRNGTIYYPHGGAATNLERERSAVIAIACTAGKETADMIKSVTNAAGILVECFDYDDAGKPLFLDSAFAPSTATSSSIGFRWLAPACAWEPEIAMLQSHGGLYSPDLGTGVSSHKEKPKKTKPDRVLWDIKENVK